MPRALAYEENGVVTGYMVFCPACKYGHLFNLTPGSNGMPGGKKPVWTFVNKDVERPTFVNSMLVKSIAMPAVDPETGRVDVKTIWVAHDCGKAICPTIVEGQMEGSAYMGAAEAIFEEHVIGEGGLHKGPNLLDYKIPTSLDVPDLVALLVESNDPEGPKGAKEAGEGPLHPSIPAIANAIFDAVGVRIDRLPFSPARVLAALREKKARDERSQKAAE